MDEVFRDDNPPNPGPSTQIFRVRANKHCDCVLLGDCFGVWTHWDGHESHPCYGEKKTCPGHRAGWPHRWKGYFHVLTLGIGGAEFFLEVTSTVVHSLWAQVGAKDNLRGLRIKLSRGAGDRAHFKLEAMPPCEIRGKLPEGKDPWDVLCKLWGIPLTGGLKLAGGDMDNVSEVA